MVDILCSSIFAHSHLFSKLTCLQKTEHTQYRKLSIYKAENESEKRMCGYSGKISTDY